MALEWDYHESYQPWAYSLTLNNYKHLLDMNELEVCLWKNIWIYRDHGVDNWCHFGGCYLSVLVSPIPEHSCSGVKQHFMAVGGKAG